MKSSFRLRVSCAKPARLSRACSLFALLTTGKAPAVELGLPADCTPGKDCFVQQFPDMDPSPGAIDPYCGSANAMADGTVLRLRDGGPDRLVLTPEDRLAVGSRECGNGVVIGHSDGVEVQYPHVHVTIRRQGEVIDPFTGRALSEGCSVPEMKPLFSRAIVQALGRGDAQLVGFGLSGSPIDHASITTIGPPAAAWSGSTAIVAWAWFLNLRRAERIDIELTGPTDESIAYETTKPVDRNKASFSAYVGKRRTPPPGDYKVRVTLLRDGKAILEQQRRFTVQ